MYLSFGAIYLNFGPVNLNFGAQIWELSLFEGCGGGGGGFPKTSGRFRHRCREKIFRPPLDFHPFFFVSSKKKRNFKKRTCHDSLSNKNQEKKRTGRRCLCLFLSQLSQRKNAPKIPWPWLPWVYAGPIPLCPNKHESSLGPHIPMGTLCQEITFPTLPTVWVPPLNYNTPATVLVNISTRSVHVNKLGFWQKRIQFKGKKGRKLDMRMCRCGGIKIQTWSCGGVHTFVQQGESVLDTNAFSFLVFIVCHNEELWNRKYDPVFCSTPTPTTMLVLRESKLRLHVGYHLLCCKNTHLGRTQLHPCRHSRAVGHWCNERNTADGTHSRCPVTTSNGLRAAGSRGTRLWAIGTRWWVHRVVDHARRKGCVGYIEENPRRRLLPRSFKGRFSFLARSICTTNSSHVILVPTNRDLSWFSVCPSY